MTSSPVLDPEAIAGLRALSPDDGDAFLREIVGIFLEDPPARLRELHASLAKGDVPAFTRAAHSIKGSSSNIGASELRATAEKLEHHAKQQGLVGVEPLQAAVEAAFARAEVELRKLLA